MDTIFALSTPVGRSAIAVLRISGPQSLYILKILSQRHHFGVRLATLVCLYDPVTSDKIDDAVACYYRAPHSYTGEDCVEISTHGARSVIVALLSVCSKFEGARLAEPGEFTRRAFLNGKLDLSAAEGIADLIDSETESQRRQALRLVQGGLRRKVELWRSLMLEISALLESQLDFSDEGDVGSIDWALINKNISLLEQEFITEKRLSERSTRLRNGYTVVLSGPVNAGKSTLFNRLAGSERAIVSHMSGTTRDILRSDLEIHGACVTVLDTAGLRQAEDGVEKIGVERALCAIASADLTLWINSYDAIDNQPAEIGDYLKIWSKGSLSPAPDADWFIIDCHNNVGVEELVQLIGEKAQKFCGDGSTGLLIRERHKSAIMASLEALQRVGQLLEMNNLELAAEEARLIINALNQIDGFSDVEDILDKIFSTFCIGK